MYLIQVKFYSGSFQFLINPSPVQSRWHQCGRSAQQCPGDYDFLSGSAESFFIMSSPFPFLGVFPGTFSEAEPGPREAEDNLEFVIGGSHQTLLALIE